MEFFATCPTGFESILARELERAGVPRTRPLQGRVSFEGELACAYRACLWSQVASRIIYVIRRGDATDADALYQLVRSIDWENHVPRGATFAIDASGTNAQLRSSQFVAQRAKDAVVDELLSAIGVRPDVNPKSPDVRIVVRVSRTRATIGIDLTGEPLFLRGYQRKNKGHSLRPDYAAALVHTAADDIDSPRELPWILDTTPGQGVLLVEAALMYAQRAPGLLRLRWGFTHWARHDKDAWERLMEEARDQSDETSDRLPALFVDAPSRTADFVRDALRTAGIPHSVRTLRAGLPDETGGLLLSDLTCLPQDTLGLEATSLSGLSGHVSNARPRALGIACRDDLASAYLGTSNRAEVQSMLGRDPVFLLGYASPMATQLTEVKTAGGRTVTVLEPTSDQFAARLRKNARLRRKWAAREDVTCYRAYDADLPDYAVSIDLFCGSNPATGTPDGRRWLNISEYAAPKGIDPSLARRRLADALIIAQDILEVSERNTFLHVRRREKGGGQYAQDARPAQAERGTKGSLPPGAHLVEEGGLVFEVNFSIRHDCGIFLDHRDTRALLRELAKKTKGSKRFLNLFAYTGTGTCYAADGGMRHTTTVDLSRPSLDWARRNMERNGFTGSEHEYVQADVLAWITEQRHSRNRWDLVFCDVPTFSNSRRMGRRSFDVQRDHVELLISVSRLLTRNGICVFSCNLRTFVPALEPLAKAGVSLEDITSQTIPEDFARNKRIHHTYLLRRKRCDT